MSIDVASVDEALTTTRAVRLRLDLDRPVDNDVIYDCIDIAEQAPSGGNQGSRRWVVVRDPQIKQQLAELYMSSAGQFMIGSRDKIAGTLYLAGDGELSSAVARMVTTAGDIALRAWLLGPSSSLRDPAAEIRLPLPDSRLKQTALILCITERGGYCLVARRGEGDQVEAYHSSDLELVEGLVNALQSNYHLQPELR